LQHRYVDPRIRNPEPERQNSLSPNAALSLQNYIRNDVKRRIVIYGTLPPE
jgi:hypothetical protein